jgi:LAO/AO transport system kinase
MRRRPSGDSAAARSPLSTDEYVRGVLERDRTVLARAITLIESNAPDHQERAQQLLQELLPRTGRSIRIGITGIPGSGKSTLIEALGRRLTTSGHRVAVMAVDPSSRLSRGSILGDKTRMEELARDERAFVRPSPTGGTLGGVARKTRETMLVFEAAGYDVLLVETVGVGQSEVTVRSMVDFFLLVLIPGGGDELQGIKRGIMELTDAVLVNKADGANTGPAKTVRAEYDRALHWLRPATEGWRTRAHTASALNGDGIDELWNVIERFRTVTTASGAFERRRRAQARDWMLEMVEERLRERFRRHPAVCELLPDLERRVMAGDLPATRAAWELLEAWGETERS